MGKLSKKIKPLRKADVVFQGVQSLGGSKDYEDYVSPLLTQSEQSYDMAKAAEADAAQVKADAAAEKSKPVMPVPDDIALARSKKKSLARRNRGRASTILADTASETLG